MRVYIAGPITGKENNNREAFEKASRIIASMGHHPVSPIKLCRWIPKGSPWVAYMRRCIAVLVKCDAICRLEGWEASRGALIENDIAYKLGIPVFQIRGNE